MSDEPPQTPEPQRQLDADEPRTNVREVLAREARRRRVVSTWTGFLLIVLGFLAFVGSYFLLPVLVVVFCLDCDPGPRPAFTAWEISTRALSLHPVTESLSSVVPLVLILLLDYLPLFAAVAIVGCSIGFLVQPQRTFATRSHRIWLVGISALGIAFPFLFIFVRPDIGYLGMLLGYGLLWGGNRLFLAEYP